MKIIKYFFQAIIIYLFFIIIKLIGLRLSRKLFSYLFNRIGPLIKSEQIINNNSNPIQMCPPTPSDHFPLILLTVYSKSLKI